MNRTLEDLLRDFQQLISLNNQVMMDGSNINQMKDILNNWRGGEVGIIWAQYKHIAQDNTNGDNNLDIKL